MKPNSEPVSPVAAHVVAKCGGLPTVRSWLNLSRAQAHRFFYPKHKSGTGGLIPHHHQSVLLDRANLEGIALKPEDFHEPPHGVAVAPSNTCSTDPATDKAA
jgi:hypothetical protein